MTAQYAVRRDGNDVRVHCLACGTTSDRRPTPQLQAAWKRDHRCTDPQERAA